MIYLIPLILILIGCFQYDRPSRKKNQGVWLWCVILVCLVMIIGFRYKVGGDTYNYMTYFEWSPTLANWEPFDASGFEPGFSLITSAIKTYFDDIYVYQTIISFIFTVLLMRFIRLNTPYKFLGMMLVFFSMYLYFATEIIRESLAVVGGLTIYPLVEKKKYILYGLLVILLSSFHASALIFLIFPLAKNMRFNETYIVILIAFLIFSFALFPLLEYLSHYYIFKKLLRYVDQINVGYAWKGFRFIYFCLLPLCVLYVNKNRFKVQIKYEGIICLQILFGIGLWIIPIIFQRLINYTIIFYLVSLSQIAGTVLRSKEYENYYGKIKCNMRRQTVTTLLVLTLLAHSSYYIHLGFYERYIPYHSIFDPIEVPERSKFVAGGDNT